MSARRLGLCCGVVGPAVWLALIFITGWLNPGFDHATDYISELAAEGSRTRTLMRFAGFVFTGFLYVCFSAALWATLRPHWGAVVGSILLALDGIGRIGAGIYPCDAGCVRVTAVQDLHKLFATLGFCSGILAALVFGALFFRLPRFRSLAWYSIGSALVAAVALVFMSSGRRALGPAGLLEHVATVALSIWVFAVALRSLQARERESITATAARRRR